MKIVFFDIIHHFGGGAQLAADTAIRLSKSHNVEVLDAYGVCEEYISLLKNSAIPTHVLLPNAKMTYIGFAKNKIRRFARALLYMPTFLKLKYKLNAKLKQISPDIVWTNSTLALALLWGGVKKRNFKVGIYACGCVEASSMSLGVRFFLKHSVDFVMTSSTETAKQLQMAGVKSERIRVVFETINFADTLEKNEAALEGPLPGLERYPRLLVPATLLRTKGQHAAIKAAARLILQGISPTLWLAGDVAGNDYSYLDYLKGLVSELGVSENVHFLGWRHDIPAVMAKSDIVVLPTHTEGFGRVALEAMLLRRPVVTTPAGGMKDSIQDGYDGLFFPVDDDEALADCIKLLMTDSGLKQKLVENGYRTVTELFNPQVHTQRIVDAMLKAMALGK